MAASGILASMSVVLGAQTADFERAMANARRELSGLNKFGEKLKGAGEVLTTYLSAPLGALAGLSVKLAGDMEKANVNFEVMLGSAEKATAVLTDLKDFAASTPFEFPEVQDAAKKLLAFNTPASELKTTLRQLGDIAAGVDAPIGEIAEIYGKARVQGRLFQEDINQLTGRGIPIIQELAKQFKVSESGVRKLVETGKVGFPNIQQAFADLTKEGGKFSGLMEKQSQTLPGLISTAFDSVKGLATDLGTEIINAFDLKGVLKNLIGFVDGVRKSFSELDPAVKKIILGVGGLAIAAGPLALAAGTLLTMLPALKVGFLALTGPVGLAVGAIAAAAVAIVANWDEIVAYFTTGAGAQVFSDLSAAVTESIGVMKDAFNELKSVGLGDLFAGLNAGDFGAFLGDIVKALGNGIRGIIEVCTGLVKTVNGIFQGDWRAAWDGLLLIADGVLAPLGIKIRNATQPYRNYIQSAAAENAVWAGSFSKFGGPLRDYGSGILTAAEATQVLATGSEAAAAKAGAVAALTEEQAKALAKLREELRQNELAYQALGNQYDFFGNKNSILTNGVKALTAVGFPPLSQVVQQFENQIIKLPRAIEAIDTPLTQFLEKINKAAEQQQAKSFNPFAGLDTTTLPELPPLPAFDTTAYEGSLQRISDAQRAATDAQAQFNTDMEGLIDSLGSRFSDLGVIIGESFGQVLAGASSIQDAMRGALAGALGVLSEFLKQYAKKVIALGIANLAINPVKGALQIAGGVALAAVAGAANGAGGLLTNPSRGNTPAGGLAPTPTARPYEAQKMKIEIDIKPVEIRQDGNALRGVLSVDQYRQTFS